MSSKKFKIQYPIDSSNDNALKVFMAHKKDMRKKPVNETSISGMGIKNRKKTFTMAYREFNKIPEKAEIAFVKNTEFIDLIRKTIQKVEGSNDAEKVWEKFKEDLIYFSENNENEKFECHPEELHDMMYKFFSKIKNFQEKLSIALKEVELMNDILTLIQMYEKEKQKGK